MKLDVVPAANILAQSDQAASITSVLGTADAHLTSLQARSVVPTSEPPGHLLRDKLRDKRPPDNGAALIIGIYPSRDIAGVAAYLRGRHIWSATVKPGEGPSSIIIALRQSPLKPSKAHTYIYRPDSDNRLTDFAAAYASGMISGIYAMLGLDQIFHSMTPTEVRKIVGAKRNDDIPMAAIERCGKAAIKVASTEEAIAVMIAGHGSMQQRYCDDMVGAR